MRNPFVIMAAAAALMNSGHFMDEPTRPKPPKRNEQCLPTSKRSKVKARRKQSRQGRKK
ncbi:hypothetical protein [Maritalea porphyrae]|uniref:hypothetical protein n=1 Tax=Maritalea porphyrae TaxID=880732 RepID=UPI0022AF3255|nr:hypothetical protein [Maritalea porphyrae]MCZ4270923.1 hypothetical protein [Maritalea porphyrae]